MIRLTSFLSSWLKDIVSLFIIISIIDLIMPKGNMKKYVNFVIGLLIIFTVINPFVKLVKKDFSLDSQVVKYIDNETYTSNKDLINEQNKEIEKIYKDKLSEEIKKVVEKNSIYKVNKTNLEIYLTNDKYGELKSMEIELIKEEEKDNKKEEIKVEDIRLVSLQDDYLERKVEHEPYDKLNDLISKEFYIDKDKIYIYIKDKGVK